MFAELSTSQVHRAAFGPLDDPRGHGAILVSVPGASASRPMPRRHLPGLTGLVFHVMNRAIEGVTLFEHPSAYRRVHSRAGGGRTTAHHRAPRLLRHAKPLASRRATHGRSSAVGVHAMADDNARAAMATGVLHPRPRRRVSGSFQVGSGRAGPSFLAALLVRRAESGSCEAHHACGAMALVECMAAGSQLLQRPDSDGVAGGATCGVERSVERGLLSCRH